VVIDYVAYESTPLVQIVYLTKMIDSIICEYISVILSLAMRVMSHAENSPGINSFVQQKWKHIHRWDWKYRLRLVDEKFLQSLRGACLNASNLTAAAVWLGLALVFPLT